MTATRVALCLEQRSVFLSYTLNVLEAARQHATERVVHTSTSEVYGTVREINKDLGICSRGSHRASASDRSASCQFDYLFLSKDVSPRLSYPAFANPNT